jgi:hypothetical protein
MFTVSSAFSIFVANTKLIDVITAIAFGGRWANRSAQQLKTSSPLVGDFHFARSPSIENSVIEWPSLSASA